MPPIAPIEPTPAERWAALVAPPVQTIATTAKIANVSPSHVKRAIKDGTLPARHLGRLVRIATPDALEWAGATAATPDNGNDRPITESTTAATHTTRQAA